MTNRRPVQNRIADVPVIMQMEMLECGAACLDMVLAYYGKWIPLEQVRKDCGVSRDGSNARSVALAAKYYHLMPRAFRYKAQSLREKATFPCIIHWNYNHFVVLKGFSGNRAYINDPARGSVTEDMETFSRAYSGVCITFEPDAEFKPEGRRDSILKYAFKKIRATGALYFFIMIVTVISALIAILEPGFLRVFVDRFLQQRDTGLVRSFTVILLVLGAVKTLDEYITCVYMNRINAKLAVSGAAAYMWKLLRLPLEFFAQRNTGDLLNRKSLNESLAGNMIGTVAPLFVQGVMVVFYLTVMLRENVLMTAVGLGAALINVFVTYIANRKIVNYSRSISRDAANLNAATISGIEMIETIKASGNESGSFNRWAGLHASLNNGLVNLRKLTLCYGVIPGLINSVASLTVTGMGVYLTMQGKFTLGAVMAFSGYLAGFSSPAESLIEAGRTVQGMTVDMERIEDVMRYPNDPMYAESSPDPDKTYEKLSGAVEISRVTFGYNRLAGPVVSDFSLSVKKGEQIAIVGNSGCGKSTVSKLLCGLYEPWEGTITYDGKPIGEIDRGVFTGSVALVDQDIVLFEDTVDNNLRMWDPSVTKADVLRATEDAHIDADIAEREGGLNARLTENGSNFSGGQRQRLEIARVLAQNPAIIILDEATSALDAKTEFEVVSSIRARGITCIVIAHRLSTIRDCDSIIVLNNGVIAEQGTHEELLARGGFYKDLITNS